MTKTPETSFAQLVETVRELKLQMERQKAELAALRSATSEPATVIADVRQEKPAGGRLSRAGLLKVAGVGAVAAAAASLELGKSTGSAFASTGNMQYGTSNDSGTDTTSLTSGTSITLSLGNRVGGNALSANSTGGLAIDCSGNGGGLKGTSTYAGAGVAGYGNPGLLGSGSPGVSGYGPTGVYGYNDYTSPNVCGVQGEITNVNPGSATAGVYGKNDGTAADGYGVQGSHAGSGVGGYFTSAGGVAVYGSTTTDYTNAISGYCTGLGSGVGGYSSSGDGVYASGGKYGVEAYGTQVALFGSSSNQGVYGDTHSTAANALGVQGVITNQAPGAASAAVYGQNNGTTANGYGVLGTQAGGGWGGYFTSVSGIGAYGNGGTGTGLLGTSTKGIGVRGTSGSSVGCYGTSGSLYGVYGSSTNSHGVFGNSTNGMGTVGQSVSNYGVYAQSTNSYGLHATGTTGLYAAGSNGRGVIATGGAAQLQLTPSTASTHPSSGQAGDFFVDSSKRIWFCTGGTTWKQVQVV